jgi:hypothetical protein
MFRLTTKLSSGNFCKYYIQAILSSPVFLSIFATSQLTLMAQTVKFLRNLFYRADTLSFPSQLSIGTDGTRKNATNRNFKQCRTQFFITAHR